MPPDNFRLVGAARSFGFRLLHSSPSDPLLARRYTGGPRRKQKFDVDRKRVATAAESPFLASFDFLRFRRFLSIASDYGEGMVCERLARSADFSAESWSSMRLPAGLCAPTCIPHLICPATPIGSFAFKNSNEQCKSHEGGKLSQKLQGTYMAALSRIAGAPLCGDAKRHTPIFQRGPAVGERQAIRDAATALAALWKIREPIKR